MLISRVDVLIPAYNAASTIRQAIASIQSQTERDLTIIVVDDGSTDTTPEILANLALDDARIRVITRPNGGIVDALNAGIDQCSSPLIARFDADDVAYPDRLEKQIAYLDAHPECLAVSGNVRHVGVDGTPTGKITQMPPLYAADIDRFPAREPHLIHPYLVVRRAAVEEIGGYRYVYHAEDADLYWRLEERGRLHNLPDVLGDYRIHNGSISSRSIRNGRLTALFSQLAAVSGRRRRLGRDDLDLAHPSLSNLDTATSLHGIFEIGTRGLDADEKRRLRMGMAAKMIELPNYRLYEPELEDCRFIRKAFGAEVELMTAENRHALTASIMTTAVRLACKGSLRSAFALLPPRRWSVLFSRVAFRIGLPEPARNVLKRSLNRI